MIALTWAFKKFRRLLTRISPSWNNHVVYWVFKHKWLNLRHPRTFHEKLVKLKLTRYNHDSLVKTCADKYAVREYLAKKGLANILVPIIACYDKVEEINWDELPQQFVLKLNFGCGYNMICTNKDTINIPDITTTLKKWIDEKYYLDNAELQYKDVPMKVFFEQYLHSKNGKRLPADYKVYCFNGRPLTILYMDDRGDDTKAVFFDLEWNCISEPVSGHYSHINKLPSKPSCLSQMVETATTLSQPFPFVRIDFYDVDDHLYFGEMTFTPAGGMFTSECLINGKPMGDYLTL